MAAIVIFINGYLCMEYTSFQDFSCKILRPAPSTCSPGPAQSGRTPEFDYQPLITIMVCCYKGRYILFVSPELCCSERDYVITIHYTVYLKFQQMVIQCTNYDVFSWNVETMMRGIIVPYVIPMGLGSKVI